MGAEALVGDTAVEGLEEHEAGAADLMAAYDLAEKSYFPAARAAALYRRIVASNSTGDRDG